MARQKLLSLAAILVSGSFGCMGAIEGYQEGSSDPGQPGQPGKPKPKDPGNPDNPDQTMVKPGDPKPVDPKDPNAVGPQPLRRLDRREYNNTIRDLLGDTSNPGDRFPSDRDTDFLFRHAGVVTSQDYSTIQNAAETLAEEAVKKIATLAPCAGGGEETCARNFATSFGLRAYRRPLVPREVDSLVELYKGARNAPMGDYANGIRATLEGILQSPAFLYHWESGPAAPTLEGDLVKLGHYETASQLSYFIWGSMPDTMLFEAAAAKKLGTQQELEVQARRMLGDAKARDTVAAFIEEWLALDTVAERNRDPKLYPEWKDDLKAAITAETRAFAANVVFEGDAKLSTLLTSNATFVNQPLAALYKLDGVTGMDMKPSSLNPMQRAGLLTQAAFLTVTGAADGSNPVKRGYKVYNRLLCEVLPDPPPEVPPPKSAAMGGTTRERFAEHSKADCARGCHAVIDPIGFAFEHYDGIGRWRDEDNGGRVDSTGTLDLDGKQYPFQDARDVVNALAISPKARSCFAKQWARFAWKRMETPGDKPSLDAIAAAFGKDNNFSVRDLMVGVVGSRSFRYRAPAEGEMLK